MIYLIAGRPRSGKSYEAVKYHVIPAIKSGRKVITNLPLNVEHFKNIHGADVAELIKVVDFNYSDFDSNAVSFPFSKPEHYEDDWRDDNGVGPLYVVDEAHFSLPKGGTHPSVKKFYTMHGHYGVDILLMTQHQRQIDGDILNLVEIVYRTIKNTALGSNNTYTKKVQDGNRGSVVNTEQRRYDKSVFPYYKSHTQSKKDVLEREASDIKAIWRHWSVYGAGICFIIVIFMFSTMDMNILAAEPPDASSVPEEPSPQPVQETPVKEDKPTEVTFVDGVKGKPDNTNKPLSDPVSQQPDEVTYGSFFKSEHPFYKVQLHISGWADVGSVLKPLKRVYFEASRNGQPLFDLELKDLLLAGYEVKVLGECLVYIQFHDFEDFVVCDTPTVGVGTSLDT